MTGTSVNLLSRSFRSEHIPKLDALRAVSALLVMLYHFGLPIPAGFGVTCFFVISGFLITRLLLSEHDRTGSVSLRDFYLRRAFRIFPAFYVYWALMTMWLAWRHKIIWGQAVSSFLYLCNYYQGLHHYPSTAFSRTWSLAVEEQFYLLWPWLFARLARRRDLLLKVLLAIVAGVWVYRALLAFAGIDEAYLYTAFECRADSIFIGCALALCLDKGLAPRLWAGLCAHRYNLALSLGALCSSLTFHRYGTGYRDIFGNVVEPLLIAVIVVQLLGIEWPLLNWLDARPVRFLGLISYSTYLYHGVAPLPDASPAAWKLVSSYTLATVSFVAVERPFLRVRDMILGRSRGIAGSRHEAARSPIVDLPSAPAPG